MPSFFEWIFPKWSRQAESTPFWKLAILSEHKMRAPEKNVPSKRCFLFENRHFLTHRPQLFRTRGILCVDTIGSPHRGILCVGKIGSVAPELDGWPGTPSKPVKSTNGPFYWLTRKRAPPCGGTLWGDPVAGPSWGTPVKTGSRPGSEVGLVLLPGDRFTSFTSHIHTHRKSSYRP